jgi:hypothetical protein
LPGAGSYRYGVKVVTDDGGASGMVTSRMVQLK